MLFVSHRPECARQSRQVGRSADSARCSTVPRSTSTGAIVVRPDPRKAISGGQITARPVPPVLRDVLHPDAEIESAWAEESAQRWHAYKNGELDSVPYEAVMAKYRKP